MSCAWVAGPGHPDDPVVPDGCTDLLWDGVSLLVAGPDTGPWWPAGGLSGVVGVRFRPGAGPPVLGVAAGALLDQRVPVAELWPGASRVEDALADATTPAAAAMVLESAVRDLLAGGDVGSDDLAVARVAPVLLEVDGPVVRALGERTGVGERQLHRRFVAAVGYGPKELHGILRYQRFLTLLADDPGIDLADAAAQCGYADQSHLTRWSTRLAGRTPAAMRDRARRVRSVQDDGEAAA